jgi:hypothetical protein
MIGDGDSGRIDGMLAIAAARSPHRLIDRRIERLLAGRLMISAAR